MITEDLRRLNLTKNQDKKILPNGEYIQLPESEYNNKKYELDT